MVSVRCFVSGFRCCFALCLFVVLLVRFGLLSGRLLGSGCPLGWRLVLVVFCLFVIFIYFPLWFKGGVCLLVDPVPVRCISVPFNEYPQSMFYSKNKKIMYTPVNPNFII